MIAIVSHCRCAFTSQEKPCTNWQKWFSSEDTNFTFKVFSSILGKIEYPFVTRMIVINMICTVPLTNIISEKSKLINCIRPLLTVKMTPDKFAKIIPRICNL